jgi:two-component system, NarL family, response regulator NreC
MLTSVSPARPEVLLVDDDEFNLKGVGDYLAQNGFEPVGAGDEATAWQIALERQPAAAVVDICIPPAPGQPAISAHNRGVQLALRLKERYPAMGVVLFSAYEDRGREIFGLIQAGLRGFGYKLKGSQPRGLLTALHDVLAGRVVIDPEVQVNRRNLAGELSRRLMPDERPWVECVIAHWNTLTPREQDVAQRLAASHNTEGIAEALSVTPKTAENYIGRVYEKLGLSNMRTEASRLRQVVILAKACLIRDLQAEGQEPAV